jgi:hypothetical protein
MPLAQHQGIRRCQPSSLPVATGDDVAWELRPLGSTRGGRDESLATGPSLASGPPRSAAAGSAVPEGASDGEVVASERLAFEPEVEGVPS